MASIHPALLEKAKRFSRQGLVRNQDEFKITNQGSWHQEVHEFGLNYRLPDVLCALGLSQLKRIHIFKTQRQDAFDNYCEVLKSIPNLVLPTKRDYVDPMWHLFPIKVPANLRKEVFEKIRQDGFLVQVNYLPANQHPVFASQSTNALDTPEAKRFYNQEISLPMMANPHILSTDYFAQIQISLSKSLSLASKAL